MNIPVDILICIATALGTGTMGFLSVVIHILVKIFSAMTDLQGDKKLEAERHANVGIRLASIEARLNLQSTETA